MATLNFPDSPSTGDTYSDANSGFEYEWNGTVWISIGAGKRSNIQEIDDISGAFNGSTTDFTLTAASTPIEPTNAQQVVISLGGVLQNVNDDYTIDGSTITFTTAPTDGLTFFGTYLNTYLAVNTVADNTVSTGSLSASSNYTVGGIDVTGVSTFSGLSLTGVSSITTLSSSNLAVSGVGTIANVIHTKDASGLGATMGAAVGVVTYFGDASNLTGVGATLYPWSYSPEIGTDSAGAGVNIVTTWSSSIEAGSGTITIRSGSASGTVVDQFVVGSSSSITIAGNSLTLNPAADLSAQIQYFVTYPAGSIKSLGGQVENHQLIYSFTTAYVPTAGKLWSFGRNNYGELGQNNETKYSSPTQIGSDSTWSMSVFGQIKGNSATGSVVHAIKTDGTLWTWGYNEEGAFGIPSYAHNASISSPVQVGTDTTWKNTLTDSGGNAISAAIKTDGTLWTWGKNQKGSLGQNAPYTAHLSSPTQVGTDTTWKMIGAGDSKTGAIKTDGTLWMWGRQDINGYLGLNDIINRSSPTQVGTDTTWNYMHVGYNAAFGVKTDGTAWTMGQNSKGDLGLNQPTSTEISSPTQLPGTTWKMADGGNQGYTIAVKTDGTMWSWGYNKAGVLGLNSSESTGTPRYSSPTQIPGTTWSFITCATSKANYALKTDGTLWSWGYNAAFGALGQNDRTTRSSPTQIPGTWSGGFGAQSEAFLYKG